MTKNDTEKPDRPVFVDDEHLEYLDELRESGTTNMFGASHFIRLNWPELSKRDSQAIVLYWMQAFGRDDR